MKAQDNKFELLDTTLYDDKGYPIKAFNTGIFKEVFNKSSQVRHW